MSEPVDENLSRFTGKVAIEEEFRGTPAMDAQDMERIIRRGIRSGLSGLVYPQYARAELIAMDMKKKGLKQLPSVHIKVSCTVEIEPHISKKEEETSSTV